MAVNAGHSGRIYVGAEDGGAAAASEITLARDISVGQSADDLDITSRGDRGWRNHMQGLKQWSVNFNLLHDEANAVHDTIESAFHAGTTISVRLVDADAEGFYGNVVVTEFPDEEAIADVMSRAIVFLGKGAPTRIPVSS